MEWAVGKELGTLLLKIDAVRANHRRQRGLALEAISVVHRLIHPTRVTRTAARIPCIAPWLRGFRCARHTRIQRSRRIASSCVHLRFIDVLHCFPCRAMVIPHKPAIVKNAPVALTYNPPHDNHTIPHVALVKLSAFGGEMRNPLIRYRHDARPWPRCGYFSRALQLWQIPQSQISSSDLRRPTRRQ